MFYRKTLLSFPRMRLESVDYLRGRSLVYRIRPHLLRAVLSQIFRQPHLLENSQRLTS
jgi:hypothetical protein